MSNVYLLGACRTAIGKMGGALSTVAATKLGSAVIRDALDRAGVPVERVDHVIMGCVLQAGLGQNPARQAAMDAGIPAEATAETLNVVCGSGLDAVNNAARMILAREADVVVAGGMENMSSAPYLVEQGRYGYRLGNGQLVDSMVNDALWDAFNDYHMGVTAENICDRWSITREELDDFSLESQRKTESAIKAGRFEDEIVPIGVKQKKQAIVFDTDESPRPGLEAAALQRLKPAFRPDGRVTPGNGSSINDGAAAVVVASERAARELGLKPMATWVGGALGGVDPSIMGIGPVASTTKLLGRLGITIDDIDLVEANEAFAAQSIAVKRELGIPDEKLNVNGGAIALGHPVGASGCRILVTLLHEMRRRGAKRGLATLCIGGGMGCSTVVEAV